MPGTLTARDRVFGALRGRRSGRVPVGAVTQSATSFQMKALGARWPEAHRDPDLMAGLAEGAHTLLGFDFVRVPFDQTVEAGLLGADVDLGDRTSNCTVRSHSATVGGPLPASPDLDTGRARAVVEAIARLRRRLKDVAVIGGVVGPFTLAGQLVGVTTLLMESLRRPAVVRLLLDFAAEVGTEYARRQVSAGADAICVEDMSVSLDLTSPRLYESVILAAQQRLIHAIDVPVILHVCGANTRILPLLARAGAAALSLDARTDLAAAVRLDACAVVGGVPPVEVLLNGTPEQVTASARECLAAGVHVLAPGCGIPPATPEANLRAMVRAVEETA